MGGSSFLEEVLLEMAGDACPSDVRFVSMTNRNALRIVVQSLRNYIQLLLCKSVESYPVILF